MYTYCIDIHIYRCPAIHIYTYKYIFKNMYMYIYIYILILVHIYIYTNIYVCSWIVRAIHSLKPSGPYANFTISYQMSTKPELRKHENA